MGKNTTILFSVLVFLIFWGNAMGQVRINEIRADDEGSDDLEFIELIGTAGTDLSGYQIVHVNGSGGGNIFTHTIGTFTLPDDGITDSETNNLGFFVLGAGGFSTGTDESTGLSLQNGPDGIILYDDLGNVLDAVAWGGAGDINGDVTTTGSPSANNYLHVTASDQGNDNSLQAPDNVVGDNGSGWAVLTATMGAINTGQTSGSIILSSPLKPEPQNHVSAFTADGNTSVSMVNLTWTDAAGSPEPDAYLIKVSTIGYASISDPADNAQESNDTDLSDDTGAFNVNSGIESASFSGLEETTTYYFKIYPYTNTGSDSDYKTDGTVPQADATTLEAPDIVLNEFLANPGGNDVNGDGTASNTEDEFIEFVNTGTISLDISSWTIEDGGGTTHTFPSSTVVEPQRAIVIFGGGTPAGDFGGAVVQAATGANLSLNNGGDDIILKNDSGLEIINFSYSSSSSGESETRHPDLTGNVEQHETADTDGGSSFSPGTRIDGFPFHPRLRLTGAEGWRMLSSPTSDNSYHDLLEPLWTQGIATGADYSGGTANVLAYDGSSFSAVNDLTATMPAGKGFIVFVYSDDDYDQSAADAGFPKTLEMFGGVTTGSVNPILTSGADAWTLVGNPYIVPVDWDDLDITDLTNTVYIYDHSYGTASGIDEEAAGVAGSYRAWNGSAGSLTDGKIAPFQGFWVQNTAGSPNPVLTFEEAGQTTGGTFYKNAAEPPVSIKLRGEMENMFSEAFLSFSDEGRTGRDTRDGLKLSPLDHLDYISLSTEVEGVQMDINNLPAEVDQLIDVPLSVRAFEAVENGWASKGGEITLSWPELINIPDSWKITLKDNETQNSVNIKQEETYTFSIRGSTQKIADKTPFSPLSPQPIRREKPVLNSRFIISINPNGYDLPGISGIPEQFALQQNYPNPFNPSTTIKYELADFSEVNLSVYNVMGQRISTLVNETKAPGAYEVTWNASDMASGIYYYRLQAGNTVFNRTMSLIK